MNPKKPAIEWDIAVSVEGRETTVFTLVMNILEDVERASGERKKEHASFGVIFCEQFIPIILENMPEEMPKTTEEWIKLYAQHQQVVTLFTFYRFFAMELYGDRLMMTKEVLEQRAEVESEIKNKKPRKKKPE